MADTAVLRPSAPAAVSAVSVATADPPPPPKNSKNKHGCYKIWHRNVSLELQQAYDAIYGLPLYASLAFISVRTNRGFVPIKTQFKARFLGSAKVSTSFSCNGAAGRDGQVQIEAASAGKDDGDFARLLVNGIDWSGNTRGLNIAVIDYVSGVVEGVASFDTHGSPSEALRFSTFIRKVSVGHILAGALRDDGSKFLLEAGRATMRSLGIPVPEADDAERLACVISMLPPERTQVLLTVCAKSNAASCASLLLDNGWDVNTRASHTQNTPLHDAVYQKNADVALVLLEKGASISMHNRWNESPNDIARIRHDFTDVHDLVLAQCSPIQSILRFLDIDVE